MKQTAVEFLEMMYIKNSILSKNDFKIAKGLEKQQINSEQIAKEHFRKQRDEGILEKAKELEREQQGYSEEEVLDIVHKCGKYCYDSKKIGTDIGLMPNLLIGFFEQFKKK